MKKRFGLFVFILLLIGLAGCEEEIEIPSNHTYLKKIIYNEDPDNVEIYNYNEDGHLVQRNSIVHDTLLQRCEFLEWGNTTSVLLLSPEDYKSTSKLIYDERLDLIYEGDWLSEIEYSSTFERSVISFSYNGQLNTVIRHDSYSVGEILTEKQVECDSKGNITKISESQGGQFLYTKIYEYDDKNNPFYKLDPITHSCCRFNLVWFLSLNNPTKETYIGWENDTVYIVDSSYEYNSDGFPVIAYDSHYSEKYPVGHTDITGTVFFEYMKNLK